MRIYAILMLLVLAASAFASYSQAMASIIAFDKERVAYASNLSDFYALKDSVKGPQVNASENHYYLYGYVSNYRFYTDSLGGTVMYDKSVEDKNTWTVAPSEWQNAISGNRLYATNEFVANPDLTGVRGDMLYASRDYIASAAQAMLDSIIFARESIAPMPDTADKMSLDSALASDEALFESKIPLIQNCTDHASLIYYGSLMSNNIALSKPRVRKALAGAARFEAANLKSMLEAKKQGTPENIPDFSASFSGFNDYNTLQVVEAAVDKSGY
ncbi:MAG TPA: hypothetical protein PLO51_03785 [Candidatus Micrarchaeota archaeon]|nr:hypothetical protein [Candidatus Micrarchaeota archaeon]